MKIKNSLSKSLVRLDLLKSGDTFESSGNKFVVLVSGVDMINDITGQVNCVSLVDGYPYQYNGALEVTELPDATLYVDG